MGIPTHAMLLADMQKLIEAQHHFLIKMKTIVKEEFNKRQVGHATFQVQRQVEYILSSFQDKIIKTVDDIGGDNDNCNSPSSPSTNHKSIQRYQACRGMVLLGWNLPTSTGRLGISQQDDSLKCMAQMPSVGP